MGDFRYIQDEDTFGLKYFEYGQAFYGSYKGMRFRIAREPMEEVWFLPAEKKAEGALVAAVWPEPYGYDATPDEKKTVSEFPFTDEGKLEMTGWLNEMYEQMKNGEN
jgi:hypothetical protein